MTEINLEIQAIRKELELIRKNIEDFSKWRNPWNESPYPKVNSDSNVCLVCAMNLKNLTHYVCNVSNCPTFPRTTF